MRQNAQNTVEHVAPRQNIRNQSGQSLYGNSNFNGLTRSAINSAVPVLPVENFYDQKDMERAFEALSTELAEGQKPSLPLDLAHDLIHVQQSLETRIGSDNIPDGDTQGEQSHNDKDNADELARTAGQLLDNVRHDQR